jgi:hypothetical protein
MAKYFWMLMILLLLLFSGDDDTQSGGGNPSGARADRASIIYQAKKIRKKGTTHRLEMEVRRQRSRADPELIANGWRSTDEDWPADSGNKTFSCYLPVCLLFSAANSRRKDKKENRIIVSPLNAMTK